MAVLRRVRRWTAAHAVDLALFLLVLAVAAPLVQPTSAQPLSRLALTAAIWDDHSLQIDGYALGIDKAERDGHVYSDKAPGQPVLAVPAYAAYRALGGEPAIIHRHLGNLGLWTVNLWSCAIPAALLAVLLRHIIARTQPKVATVTAGAIVIGTLLLPFASVLFGHVLSTLLAVAGWSLLIGPRAGPKRLLASGALLGAAVLVEYTMILVAVIVVAMAVWRWRAKVGWLLVGAAPAALALLAYQWAAFGSPFEFSYANSSFNEEAEALGLPAVDNVALKVVFGERGLLLVSPLVLVGLVGSVVLIRRLRAGDQVAYVAATASALAMIAVQMLWSNPTGGDAPGPRYATAAAAFLAPGVAEAWVRWRRVTIVAAAWGVLVMVAATWTAPLEARDSTGAITIWLDKLTSGDRGLTVYEMALDSWAWWLLPLAALGALVLLINVSRPDGRTP